MTKRRKSISYLLLAVLAEIIIFTDSLALWLSRLMTADIVLQSVIGFVLTYIFWGLGIWTLRKLYKRNEALHFTNTEQPTHKQLLFGLLLLAISVAISYTSWGGFKVALELMNGIKNGGAGLGIAYFIAQYVHYFLEVVLFFQLIKYAQKAGESLFGKEKIPYGGIALAVLWGLPHILFHGVVDGLTTTLIAFLMGIAYLAVRKNPSYAFPLIFLMFIL